MVQATLLAARNYKERFTLDLKGGTNVMWAPPIDTYSMVLFPLMERMGIHAKLDIIRRGFYPIGGGEVKVTLDPMGNIKPIFAMPGGGTTQGHVEDLYKKFGKDVMIAAGGAIHGHPMGPAAGARAFRQAIDAVVAGRSLEEAAGDFQELKVALDLWGIYSEKKGGLFDLKG